jgi:cation transport regulator ChaB
LNDSDRAHPGNTVVPYSENIELPPAVRSHLPPQAAHRIAWAAVKRRYPKVGGKWVART